MNELKQTELEYKKYRDWGYNQYDSAKNAVEISFKHTHSPHIFKDEYGDASHIFYNKAVLFFNDGIFTSI